MDVAAQTALLALKGRRQTCFVELAVVGVLVAGDTAQATFLPGTEGRGDPAEGPAEFVGFGAALVTAFAVGLCVRTCQGKASPVAVVETVIRERRKGIRHVACGAGSAFFLCELLCKGSEVIIVCIVMALLTELIRAVEDAWNVLPRAVLAWALVAGITLGLFVLAVQGKRRESVLLDVERVWLPFLAFVAIDTAVLGEWARVELCSMRIIMATVALIPLPARVAKNEFFIGLVVAIIAFRFVVGLDQGEA